jgi:hypothetical protein
MKNDELIAIIDKSLQILDVDYGDIPYNPAYIMRESKKKIIELEDEIRKIHEKYMYMLETYQDL